MGSKLIRSKVERENTRRVNPKFVELGQWYWVRDEEEPEWLGCVVKIGSNYVELEAPHSGSCSYNVARVLHNDIGRSLRPEPMAKQVIQKMIDRYQSEIQEHMGAVRELTSRLGVGEHPGIEHRPEDSGKGLAVLSSQSNIERYKKSLLRAKDKDLPALFEKLKEANEQLGCWMAAETLALQAQCESVKDCLESIEDRIFNISLYAGLTESVVHCAGGVPAAFDEKLRVMQRQLYMDEECLLGYMQGGLEFRDIEEFDRWLVKTENRDRILPFPRCIVAMRVRRKVKERDWGGSLKQIFINLELKQSDMLTFLYLRNGDQVYRMDCDLDFGETLFPDQNEFDPNAPMMVNLFGDRVREIMNVHAFEECVREHREREARAIEWARRNRGKSHWANPYRGGSFDPDDWSPLDSTNPYFDECMKEIVGRIQQYNRIALIIQGLLDRSPVFHPHPSISTWNPEQFQAHVELVNDSSLALHYGDPPDFEAYRASCNASITQASVLIGQDRYWQRREALKECERLDRDWRVKSEYRPEYYQPFGNPGPGYIARPKRWLTRAKKAVFTWYRERVRDYGQPIPASITVPMADLFNVSAYQPGDYKRFFVDPRTRANYLKWAPVLLAAEEFHAGNLKAREPDSDE